MKTILRITIAALSGLVMLGNAREAFAKGGPLLISGSLMGFFNSSKQGGDGPEGSTLLTQVDIVKQWDWYGLGVFGQFDKQGSAETDLGYGPKIELHKGPFYIEGGYIFSLTRSFTDRSIEEQTGYGWLVGAGARFSIGKGGKGKGLFMQFSYKYRIHNVKKQDGTSLSDPIIQRDGYPLFGIGMDL